ncbi:MAG: DNA repair protein RadC [Bacteroides sp.]|nr:DNA repair protein RadC [Roseburia sp.]MCM1346498.1 DNA repair protein RadC [Bacteroides sp.]MCM1421050.1 DNA repair protein RadC [Bacteroides sp.]
MIRKSFHPFNEAEPVEETPEAGKLSIKNWAEEDRPREKLLAKGADALTKAELLAILIGSGTPKKSAVELMTDVLRDCDNKLSRLSRMSVAELMAYNGIGEAKAVTLKAAAEIGRLRAEEDALSDVLQFRDSSQIYKYMLPLMRDLNHEECWALMLNNNARLMKRVRISMGGMTETSVDVRVLMKEALLSDATCVVLVHNHPSGACRPSSDDIRLTEKVSEAGKIMSIRLIDHLIVTDGKYYSFADEGRL